MGVVYERRRPERTTLYEVVRDNVETLYGAIDDGAIALRIPEHAKKELEAHLDCGLLCRGFAWLTKRSKFPVRREEIFVRCPSFRARHTRAPLQRASDRVGLRCVGHAPEARETLGEYAARPETAG